jgi:hypothetical protein
LVAECDSLENECNNAERQQWQPNRGDCSIVNGIVFPELEEFRGQDVDSIAAPQQQRSSKLPQAKKEGDNGSGEKRRSKQGKRDGQKSSYSTGS